MAKILSIGELINRGLIRKGNYIDYIPDGNTYTTIVGNTGWKDAQFFVNNKMLNWRVAYIEGDKIFIIPSENIVNNFYLSGIIGYMNGVNELNNICLALASNRKLNVKARSVNIEDINKINGFIPKESEKRIVFYSEGSIAYGSKKVDGKKYIKTVLGFKDAKFYTSDFGGQKEKDENGLTYVTPKKNNPVFVTDTVYYYDIMTDLFNDAFWLASTCVSLNMHDVYFNIRSSGYGWASSSVMQSLSGCSYVYAYGVKPLVMLSSEIMINVSDELMDGSTPNKAWKFANVII